MNKEKVKELLAIKGMIEDPLFQKYINDPVKKELNALGKSYTCDSLHQLNRLKGESKGLKYLLKLFKGIQTDCENEMIEPSES